MTQTLYAHTNKRKKNKSEVKKNKFALEDFQTTKTKQNKQKKNITLILVPICLFLLCWGTTNLCLSYILKLTKLSH
jgi:uncharacterized ion transporter superfamily protein YfcC